MTQGKLDLQLCSVRRLAHRNVAVLTLVRCFIWFRVLNRGFAIGPVLGYILSTGTLVDERDFLKASLSMLQLFCLSFSPHFCLYYRFTTETACRHP
jgi:hypothetical protein